MECILGIIGIVCYFINKSAILWTCTLLIILLQIRDVIKKIQNSLNTVCIFAAVGLVISLIFKMDILNTVALFACIESVVMCLIFPTIFKHKRKVSGDKIIDRMYLDISRALKKAVRRSSTFIFIDRITLNSYIYRVDDKQALISGSTFYYIIERDDEPDTYVCTILINQVIGYLFDDLEEYRKEIKDKYSNCLLGIGDFEYTEDKSSLVLKSIIKGKNTDKTFEETIVRNIVKMLEVSKKVYFGADLIGNPYGY